MRIAIPSEDKILTASHFGRAPWFVFFETETKEYKYIDNSSHSDSSHGAGVNTASLMLESEVDTLISPILGPKATDLIKNSSIKVYKAPENSTVEEVLTLYFKNSLEIQF